MNDKTFPGGEPTSEQVHAREPISIRVNTVVVPAQAEIGVSRIDEDDPDQTALLIYERGMRDGLLVETAVRIPMRHVHAVMKRMGELRPQKRGVALRQDRDPNTAELPLAGQS